MQIGINTLNKNELEKYKALRFKALEEEIYSFGKYYEEEANQDDLYFLNLVAHNKNKVFIAKNKEKFIGITYVKFTEDLKNRHSVELSGVYVLPEYRGKGIAKLLINKAINYLKNFPEVIKVRLSIIDQPNSPRKLYENLGFKEVGRYSKELFINKEYFDEVLFELVF